MIDAILPEGLNVKQKAAAVIGIISIVIVGIGVFIYKAGDFETDVKIYNNTTTSSDNEQGKIWVDVEGAVNSPGVFTLEQGSRVDDAINAAGGVSSEADKGWIEKNINKAQILTDGYKLYLPQVQQEGITSNTQVSEGKISINSAAQKQLEELPGIGPVTAQKIIEGRPYMALEDLKTKKIVGSTVWENIKEKISLW